MNPRSMKKRLIAYGAILLAVVVFVGYPFLIEPRWAAIREVNINDKPEYCLVHITDIHYHGEQAFLSRVIDTINRLDPDFVCFTGDLVEREAYLTEALAHMLRIACPVYGVPGNWDLPGRSAHAMYQAAFAATGGAWLEHGESARFGERVVLLAEGAALPQDDSGDTRSILLTHYPAAVDRLGKKKYDLILAGHSHGGQVRLPFYGPLVLPPDVGEYDRGLFRTQSGPLYVNPGLGYWYLQVRFLCRPEITVIRL